LKNDSSGAHSALTEAIHHPVEDPPDSNGPFCAPTMAARSQVLSNTGQ